MCVYVYIYICPYLCGRVCTLIRIYVEVRTYVVEYVPVWSSGVCLCKWRYFRPHLCTLLRLNQANQWDQKCQIYWVVSTLEAWTLWACSLVDALTLNVSILGLTLRSYPIKYGLPRSGYNNPEDPTPDYPIPVYPISVDPTPDYPILVDPISVDPTLVHATPVYPIPVYPTL